MAMGKEAPPGKGIVTIQFSSREKDMIYIDLYYSRHQGYSKIIVVYSITLSDDI